jgi:hypothetical protein
MWRQEAITDFIKLALAAFLVSTTDVAVIG